MHPENFAGILNWNILQWQAVQEAYVLGIVSVGNAQLQIIVVKIVDSNQVVFNGWGIQTIGKKKVNDALLMISQVNWFGKLDNDHDFSLL